ncbi:MAG: DUF3298 and DUF4163 domain-containing protein [Methylococcales bacterium]|nr:DUF3298 and DUF4163 domain-containing protein [Methylococcales bacterium]
MILFLGLQVHSKTLKPEIKSQSHKKINQKERWGIDVIYPKITSKNTENAKDFNRRAKKIVMDEVHNFKKMFLEEKVDASSAPYDLIIGYEVTFLSPNLVSILFIESSYSGGAHGNKESYTLNYDLKKGTVLKLVDLFKKNTTFIKIISTESIQQILKKQGTNSAKEWVEEGAGQHINNFTAWNITPIGLMFSFDPYQVASYAEGDFTTKILYQKFPSKIQSPYFSVIKK